jgi:amino acid transporter
VGVPGRDVATGSLAAKDAVATSVSLLAPGVAMLLVVPGVSLVAGGSAPLAFLLGGIACLALAFVVVGSTRRLVSAGNAYTYVSRRLGRSAGFVAGWLYAFGVTCFVPMTMAAAAFLTRDLLGLGSRWWFPLFGVGMVLLVGLSIVRVAVTTRVQLVIGIITVVTIVLVDLAVTVVSVSFAIVFYLWTAYRLSIGFGVENGAAFGADPFAVKTIATRFAAAPLGMVVELGALLSAFVVCVGCATAATRTLQAMGRDGALPGWLGSTHPRFRTPVNATATVSVIATALAAIVGFGLATPELGSNPAMTVFYFFAMLGTLAVNVVYMGLCAGGAVFFRLTRFDYNIGIHLVVPLVGMLLLGAALYGSVYPAPPTPLDLTPYVMVAWILIGVIVVITVGRARNSGTTSSLPA